MDGSLGALQDLHVAVLRELLEADPDDKARLYALGRLLAKRREFGASAALMERHQQRAHDAYHASLREHKSASYYVNKALGDSMPAADAPVLSTWTAAAARRDRLDLGSGHPGRHTDATTVISKPLPLRINDLAKPGGLGDAQAAVRASRSTSRASRDRGVRTPFASFRLSRESSLTLATRERDRRH